MENLKFTVKKKLPTYAVGGVLQQMQPGGVVEGPPHSQGGVPVVNAQAKPIAEVEGGERIFSIEDTQQLEQMSMAIMEASQQDPASAEQMATELGYAVVQMLVGQEINNPSQQQVPVELMENATGVGEMLPPGGGEAYMEQPI